MFGNSKTNKLQNRIDCLIGAGTTIEGNIVFSGGLRVDGHVRGDVIAADEKPGTLVLSEQAHIEGEIRVSHVVINGTVVGPSCRRICGTAGQGECHRRCILSHPRNATRRSGAGEAGLSTRG